MSSDRSSDGVSPTAASSEDGERPEEEEEEEEGGLDGRRGSPAEGVGFGGDRRGHHGMLPLETQSSAESAVTADGGSASEASDAGSEDSDADEGGRGLPTAAGGGDADVDDDADNDGDAADEGSFSSKEGSRSSKEGSFSSKSPVEAPEASTSRPCFAALLSDTSTPSPGSAGSTAGSTPPMLPTEAEALPALSPGAVSEAAEAEMVADELALHASVRASRHSRSES